MAIVCIDTVCDISVTASRHTLSHSMEVSIIGVWTLVGYGEESVNNWTVFRAGKFLVHSQYHTKTHHIQCISHIIHCSPHMFQKGFPPPITGQIFTQSHACPINVQTPILLNCMLCHEPEGTSYFIPVIDSHHIHPSEKRQWPHNQMMLNNITSIAPPPTSNWKHPATNVKQFYVDKGHVVCNIYPRKFQSCS